MSLADVGAVVLAAGAGRRMGGATNKVFLPISGRPVLARTIDLFESHPRICRIVLVAAPTEITECQELIARQGYRTPIHVVPGGTTRHQSEFFGLQAMQAEIQSGAVRIVLVHDAVRPFVARQLIDRLIDHARRSGAAIPGMRVGAGIAAATEDGDLAGWLDDLWAVQTPQAFDGVTVLRAHEQAAAAGFEGTDTSSVVERAGHRVSVVEGSAVNIKITTSDDLLLAEHVARRWSGRDELEQSALNQLSHL